MTAQEQLGLGELVERVKSASGPDRKLDHDLYAALICTTPELKAHLRGMDAGNGHGYPAYSYSIDAALALTERMLPGWQINISAFGNVAEASLGGRGVFPYAQAPTPPLAILQALLTALLNTKENGE